MDTIKQKVKTANQNVLQLQTMGKNLAIPIATSITQQIQNMLNQIILILENHSILLSVDIDNLVKNVVQISVSSLVLLYSTIFCLVFISLFLIASLWDNHRTLAFVIVIGLFLSITIISLMALIQASNNLKKTLSNTIDQLSYDQLYIQNLLQ